MRFSRHFPALLCLAALCCAAFGLAACAGRGEAPTEPQVKVRGQYDVSIGVRR